MSMKPCPETFPYPLIALDETDSTNRYISQLCNELQESVAELTTVTAEFQSAGKGQRSRQQKPMSQRQRPAWQHLGSGQRKESAFQFCPLSYFSGSTPPVYPVANRFPLH